VSVASKRFDRDDPRFAYRFALIATRFPHSRFAFVRTERGEGGEACFKFIKRFTSIEHALSDRARARANLLSETDVRVAIERAIVTSLI